MPEQNNLNVLQRDRRHPQIVDLRRHRERRHDELLADARTLMMECRDEEALASCTKALRLIPDSEAALLLASTLSAVRGDSPEGLRFALEMVQLDPQQADGYYEVAMSLLDMGHAEEALAWLEMGHRHLDDRTDDILDHFTAANAEAMALLCDYERAMATLEEAREARGDELGLLNDASRRVEQLSRRPDC